MSDIGSVAPEGYVDGFVIVVPQENFDQYREQACVACNVWMEHGALDYVETVGDDLDSDFGNPFPALVGKSESELIIFAYVRYRDKAHRDEVNAKVMADERIKAMCPDSNPDFVPPFDMKRFSYGGFSVIVKS